MSELLTGLCPNCGSKLTYRPGDSTVMCFACDSSVEVAEFAAGTARGAGYGIGSGASVAAFMGFDNPESGVVFLENFFETYDWETYQHTSDIAIPEIAEVIGNNKVKNGAVPETWYLDFMGLYVPVSKKFEALKLFEDEINKKFNPIDPTEIFTAFDHYRAISKVLKAEEKAIIKTLNAAIKYAERFALASDKLSAMKSNLSALSSAFSGIATKKVIGKNGEAIDVIVDKIEELPAYTAARNAYAARNKAEYSERGIDAEAVYAEAVEQYEAGNKARAISLFESIREYSDSAIYIRKINQYFNFDDELYRFAGKHFIYKQEDYTLEALNVKKITKKVQKQMDASGQGPVSALSLYEVVDGVPAKEPTIKGIDKVITCYGSKFYFFKNSKGIVCYDISSGVETVVDNGETEQYQNESGAYFDVLLANHAPIFAIKKRFKEQINKGCFGKKSETLTNDLNPYTIVLVDMAQGNSRVVVSEMVDIKLRKDDKIFYTFAYKIDGVKGCFAGCRGKKTEDKPKTCLMVCDIANGTTTKILDEDCEIHAVKDDLIIYTLWKPNDLNEDLHVYNMSTGGDTVIEKNVYEFFGLIDGMIYYTIGNAEFRPLVRNNFEGTQREQVMLNVAKIEAVRAGWFYVKKGSGYNAALVKVRVDGKERLPLCTALKKVHRFDGNYIYYQDVYDNMRVVRIDGKENRILASKVTKVFPAQDGLYYCREEAVDDQSTALSLYKMDKDGLNIKKIVFNVDVVQNDETANSMYYSKTEEVRFKVYKEGKEDKAFYSFFTLTKFYSFKKASAGEEASEPELILTLGLPENTEKTGCLAKFQKDYIYEEAPIVHSYKNRGLTDAEIMAEEEEEIPVDNNGGIANGGCKGCAPQASKKTIKSLGKMGNKNAGNIALILLSIYLLIFSIINVVSAMEYRPLFGGAIGVIFALVSAFLALASFKIIPIFKFQIKKFAPIAFTISTILQLLAIFGEEIF